MVYLFDIPTVGKLEIVEVYEYYDQPVLYSCNSASGKSYLVVAADEDDQYLTWLCVEVSPKRLSLIRLGSIDLHDAFSHAENTYAIIVKVPFKAQMAPEIDFIESKQIPEDMLPIPGERLDFATDLLPVLSGVVQRESQEEFIDAIKR